MTSPAEYHFQQVVHPRGVVFPEGFINNSKCFGVKFVKIYPEMTSQ